MHALLINFRIMHAVLPLSSYIQTSKIFLSCNLPSVTTLYSESNSSFWTPLLHQCLIETSYKFLLDHLIR